MTDTPGANKWRLVQEHEGPNHRLEVHNQTFLASASRNDDEVYRQLHNILEAFAEQRGNDHDADQPGGQPDQLLPRWPSIKGPSLALDDVGPGLKAHPARAVPRSGSIIHYFGEVTATGESPQSEIPGFLLDLQEKAIAKATLGAGSANPSRRIHRQTALLVTHLPAPARGAAGDHRRRWGQSTGTRHFRARAIPGPDESQIALLLKVSQKPSRRPPKHPPG